ncbi:hypothetical protein H0Z60_01360 [Ectothiorhodospiraceae bacterium WFHF3C12]|nr:hypothetical protein [Ectothiorhodospiraceae bacterium WFHF3C12]
MLLDVKGFLLAAVIGLVPVMAQAHHGWAWATDEDYELTGTVVAVRLGNPHGEVDIARDGERWTVEVGQPWRNDRAGLTAELLREGRVITARGHRSANADERLLKAESVTIDGRHYVLYPNR